MQAALDVFNVEPPPADSPLVNRQDVVCTPHLGASTTEAQEGVAVEIADAVIGALKVSSLSWSNCTILCLLLGRQEGTYLHSKKHVLFKTTIFDSECTALTAYSEGQILGQSTAQHSTAQHSTAQHSMQSQDFRSAPAQLQLLRSVR